MTRDIEQTRENLSRDVDELTDKVSPSRIAHRRKVAATSKLRTIREQIMGSVSEGGDKLSSATHDVGDAATGAVEAVEDKARGNPLGAGLVAFGAGVVLSSLIPASRAETQAAQRAMDVAKEQGGPLMDEAKAATQSMVGELKDSAARAAEEVKATAQDSAGTVQNEAMSSAENVKDAAPTS